MSHLQPLVVREFEFGQKPETYMVRPGQTLREMMLETTQGKPLADDIVVRVAGEFVPREYWGRLRPKPGTHIYAYRTAQLQGGSARQIIGMVALIAVSIMAPGWGTAIANAAGWGATAATAISVGITMAAALAIGALTKPPTPGAAQGTEGQWYQLTGSSNNANPWGVIPFVIGEAKWFPPHAALPYSETVGEKNYMHFCFDLGYGDVEVVGTPKIGESPLTAFQGVQWEVTKIPTLYVNDVSEARVDSTIEHLDHVPIMRTTAPGVTSISLDLIYPQGHFGVGTSGKTFSMWTAWRIRYRPVGTTTWLTPTSPRRSGLTPNKPASAPLSATANFWVESTKKKPFGTSLAWDVPAGQYEVEVTRMDSLRGGSKNTYVDTAVWTVLRSIKNGNPSRTGTTKLAMRIQANDQVNQMLRDFSVMQRQLIREYDRDTDSWSEPKHCLNPAWIVAWLLSACPSVDKDQHVPLSRLDLDGFADYAEFCEANSFEARGVCDSPQLLGDLINDILACSLGSLGMRDGRYSPVFDPGDVQPTMVFTPAETANFRMERPFIQLPHALRVQFVNPEADWQQDEIIVLDDGYSYRGVDARGNPSSDPEPERFETMQLRYAADAIHAWRVGRYHLAQGKFRQAIYSWDSDLAGLGTVRGDCVEVPNDVLEWGEGWGRVLQLSAGGISGAAATLVLDTEIETEAGHTYRAHIRRGDGTVVTADLAAAGGETSVFALASMPEGVQPGDVATLVRVSRELTRLLVTGVTYSPNLDCSFTAVAYDPRVAPYWADPPESIVSEISGRQFGIPDPPIIDGVVSSPENDDADDAGIVGPVIRIGLRRPSHLVNDARMEA